jgi:hypothetical protein
VLVPSNWQTARPNDRGSDGADRWEGYFRFHEVDRRPTILRRLFPVRAEPGELELGVIESHTGSMSFNIGMPMWKVPVRETHKSYEYPDLKITVQLDYARADVAKFNRTYRQICNGLRIE